MQREEMNVLGRHFPLSYYHIVSKEYETDRTFFSSRCFRRSSGIMALRVVDMRGAVSENITPRYNYCGYLGSKLQRKTFKQINRLLTFKYVVAFLRLQVAE